jgi:hypothetical protein
MLSPQESRFGQYSTNAVIKQGKKENKKNLWLIC